MLEFGGLDRYDWLEMRLPFGLIRSFLLITGFCWAALLPSSMLASQRSADSQQCQLAQDKAAQGRQSLRYQNFEEAIQELRSARSLCPKDDGILPDLARAYIGARDFPEAEETARDFVQKEPASVQGQFLLGYSYFLERRFRNAAQTLQLLLRQDPQNGDALRVMGMTLFFMGDYSPAQHALADELKIHPDDEEALYFLGGVYYAKGFLPKALESYLRLTKLNPKSYQAFDNLGLCYRKLGKTEQAIAAFRKSESLSKQSGPPYDNPFTHLAGLLLEKRRYKEALPSAQAAVRIDPASPVNQYLMGNLCFHANDFQSALSFLNRSAAMDKDFADPHYLLGKIYHQLGQEQRSKQEFATFEKLNRKQATGKIPPSIIVP